MIDNIQALIILQAGIAVDHAQDKSAKGQHKADFDFTVGLYSVLPNGLPP
jgi:hypothetical protein